MVKKVITPGQSIDLIMQEAKRRGLDWFQPHHAAGMAGSFMQETGDFREDVINFKVRGDKNTAYGLMQWRGDRWENLKEFSKEKGTAANDIRTQISFAFEEGDAGSKYSDFGSKKSFRQMQSARNSKDSAIAFVHAERPAGYDGNPLKAHDVHRRISHASRAVGGAGSAEPANLGNVASATGDFGVTDDDSPSSPLGGTSETNNFSKETINRLKLAGFEISDFGLPDNIFDKGDDVGEQQVQAQNVDFDQTIQQPIQSQNIDFNNGFSNQSNSRIQNPPVPVAKNKVFGDNLTFGENYDKQKAMFGV